MHTSRDNKSIKSADLIRAKEFINLLRNNHLNFNSPSTLSLILGRFESLFENGQIKTDAKVYLSKHLDDQDKQKIDLIYKHKSKDIKSSPKTFTEFEKQIQIQKKSPVSSVLPQAFTQRHTSLWAQTRSSSEGRRGSQLGENHRSGRRPSSTNK